jgi:hypothetical protein
VNKIRVLALFSLVFLVVLASGNIVSFAMTCHNSDSTGITSVYVLSSISGSNPDSSSGSGYASASLTYFCVISAWHASFSTEYRYTDGYGGTGSGSHSFSSPQGWTGDWVDTSVREYCQGAAAGVTAFLEGRCGT